MKMNKTIWLFAALVSFLGFNSCDADDEQQVTTFTNLVFEDNFDVDGAPDPTKWSADIGRGLIDGWGNNELQYYTNRTENVKVENGYLVINAQKESYEGYDYTSARLKTKNLFEQKYGRFEARMRLPFGQGLWPAFWMLGSDFDYSNYNTWPACGEIDIFEYVIRDPNATSMAGTLHGPGYSGGNAISNEYELENSRIDTEFHVYGAEWTANHINFYVDDVLYAQVTKDDVEAEGTWAFDDPAFMILNLAVGGFGQAGPTFNTTQTMLVDYVRVYQ